MKLRKLNRIVHRDLGYFFTGMILIYCITGIFLNHARDWNPYYYTKVDRIAFTLPIDTNRISRELIIEKLAGNDEFSVKSYYYPEPGTVKIFLKNGTITAQLGTDSALVEQSFRRPLLYQLNLMHKKQAKIVVDLG